jgi:hypothetical protein
MINPVITNNTSTNSYNIGAVVCHTPKTLYYDNDDKVVDHRREFITSVSDLVKYFGDPFISPSDYSDLILIYDLVRRGNSLYISSVKDMTEHDDGFLIKYNGYTDFKFYDSNNDILVGYRLKSNIKFCQPFIRSTYSNGILSVYVDLYRMDRALINDATQLAKLNSGGLYTTYYYEFENGADINDLTLVNALWKDGLELKIVNLIGGEECSLVEVLRTYPALNVHFDSFNNVDTNPEFNPLLVEYYSADEHYKYTANGQDYSYNLESINDIDKSYIDAVKLLLDLQVEPTLLYITKLCKSVNLLDSNSNVVRSVLTDLDYDSAMAIYSFALDLFNEESNTYLYINMPNVTGYTAKLLLYSDEYFRLPERYNCDLYFGVAIDYIENNLIVSSLSKVNYTAALLSFYNMIDDPQAYISNSVSDLNISNASIKSSITESLANQLANLRCNSLVLFDTGSPSIYGDRTLSLLPNLRYSHIARNFIRLRKIIRDYLETKKFCLNTPFSIDTYVNYISHTILDSYESSGILSNYNVTYSTAGTSVYINVTLTFNPSLSIMNLTFTI